jgi:hypothetical protein
MGAQGKCAQKEAELAALQRSQSAAASQTTRPRVSPRPRQPTTTQPPQPACYWVSCAAAASKGHMHVVQQRVRLPARPRQQPAYPARAPGPDNLQPAAAVRRVLASPARPALAPRFAVAAAASGRLH